MGDPYGASQAWFDHVAGLNRMKGYLTTAGKAANAIYVQGTEIGYRADGRNGDPLDETQRVTLDQQARLLATTARAFNPSMRKIINPSASLQRPLIGFANPASAFAGLENYPITTFARAYPDMAPDRDNAIYRDKYGSANRGGPRTRHYQPANLLSSVWNLGGFAQTFYEGNRPLTQTDISSREVAGAYESQRQMRDAVGRSPPVKQPGPGKLSGALSTRF